MHVWPLPVSEAAAVATESMSPCVASSAVVLSLLCAVTAHGQSVDEIVAKNLQAKGCAEQWNAVTAVNMTGQITMQGVDLPLPVYAKRPNLNRQEVTLPSAK